MPENEKDVAAWKEKYYDQLDRLEKKEQHWGQLESTLKRAVSRLSYAAEGQQVSLDGHVKELRAAIKKEVDCHRVENIVDKISRVLKSIEANQPQSERAVAASLQQLLNGLVLPGNLEGSRSRLVKKLEKANDDQRDALINDTATLLKSAFANDEANPGEKSGLLGRLFQPEAAGSKAESTVDFSALGSALSQCMTGVPWPASIAKQAQKQIALLRVSQSETAVRESLLNLEEVLKAWPELEAESGAEPDKIEPSGRSADDRSLNLPKELVDQVSEEAGDSTAPEASSVAPEWAGMDTAVQPPLAELLIRLLQQLVVPPDFEERADAMKQRLEKGDPKDWKFLLKDVAALINSIRSYLQKEKREFEDFLLQVTDRLKSMDEFLKTESDSLVTAQSVGKEFDQALNMNVGEIRQDVAQATELASLKETVSSKLDAISSHMENYRESEHNRIELSKQQIQTMQARMQELEKESETLKQVLVEKNKQAMFDTLTGIPNRLSYDEKVEEEMSRWNRSNKPLSLAVWDIDFFKKVNDNYGHKAGDKVLRIVAQLLYKRIRTTDFFARYGGEEFVMLLPGASQAESLVLADKLRQEVENCGFHNSGESVSVTVSCGISSFQDGDSVEQVFERADRALYQAKKNGRNQCVAAPAGSTE